MDPATSQPLQRQVEAHTDNWTPCPRCGHRNEHPNWWSIIFLEEVQLGALLSFLNGELDDMWCQACRGPTGLRATILFAAPGHQYLLPGTVAAKEPENLVRITAAARLSAEQQDAPIDILDSISELRRVVNEHLKATALDAKDLLGRPDSTSIGLTPRHFVALATGALGTRFGFRDICKSCGLSRSVVTRRTPGLRAR